MFSSIGPWQLLIVLVIVVIVFGTNKLRNVGSDLGSAVKGFKKAVGSEEEGEKLEEKSTATDAKVSAEKSAAKTSDKQKDSV